MLLEPLIFTTNTYPSDEGEGINPRPFLCSRHSFIQVLLRMLQQTCLPPADGWNPERGGSAGSCRCPHAQQYSESWEGQRRVPAAGIRKYDDTNEVLKL